MLVFKVDIYRGEKIEKECPEDTQLLHCVSIGCVPTLKEVFFFGSTKKKVWYHQSPPLHDPIDLKPPGETYEWFVSFWRAFWPPLSLCFGPTSIIPDVWIHFLCFILCFISYYFIWIKFVTLPVCHLALAS